MTLAEHPTAGMCVQRQSQGVVGRTEIGSSDSDSGLSDAQDIYADFSF